MSNLSVFTKNGQTLQFAAGQSAIDVNDLIEVGGPGNEAYPVTTIDYALTQGTNLFNEQQVGAKTSPGSARMAMARDRIGNIYILSLNSSGHLTVSKYKPLGWIGPTATLDASTSNAYTVSLLALSNGSFAAVYARADGELKYLVFDTSLNIVVGPTAVVANEYHSSSVVYHDAVALSGGGFAVVYQTSAGTAVNLHTYSNAGVETLSATNITTLSGSASQAVLRLMQLSNGNLLCVMRGAMTSAGTRFVIVTTAGVSVVANTLVDSTATIGLIDVDVLPGYFAIATQNGSNLICAVFTNAGAVQGTAYSVADTLNATTYVQFRVVNDGAKFWLAYIGSVSVGVTIAQIPLAGTGYVTTTGFGSATFTTSNWSLDAQIINGLLTVFAASIGAGGQYWMTLGLPDDSLGAAIPYVRTSPTSFGSSAATTGCYWPRLYNAGDWVGIFIYDNQNAQKVNFSIQRFERGSVVGVAQTAVAASTPGSLISVNAGPGTYICNSLVGSSGMQFDQGASAPFGNVGTLYNNGVSLTGIPAVPGTATPSNMALTGVFGSGEYSFFKTSGTFTVPDEVTSIRVRVWGGGQSGGPSAGNGGTTSFGSVLSATGGTSGGVGAGTGGQYQASGGAGGAATGNEGGGGGGCGSMLGNGGAGGNAGDDAGGEGGGGGGGIGGSAGNTAIGLNGYGGGGGGVGGAAAGAYGGASSEGDIASPTQSGATPTASRFPFDAPSGGGGGGAAPSSAAGAGGAGGGGGGEGANHTSPGAGGAGGGGGGASGLTTGSSRGAPGGYGGGGGGCTGTTGGAGGRGAGFAIGVFFVVPGQQFTVTVGAAGSGNGGAGGAGGCVVEW